MYQEKPFDDTILSIEKISDEYQILFRNSLDDKLYIEKWSPEEYQVVEKQIVFEMEEKDNYISGFYGFDSNNIIQNDNNVMIIDNRKILRYDLDNKNFIDKILLGGKYSINFTKFDKLNNMLYVFYQHGYVSKIDFSKDIIREEKFTVLHADVSEIFMDDSKIILEDYYKTRRYIFSKSGELIFVDFDYDISEGYTLNKLTYDESNNKVFFRADDKKLYSVKINSLGELIEKVEKLEREESSTDRLVFSNNKENVLFGEKVYKLNTLEELSTFNLESINFFYWDEDYFIYPTSPYHYRSITIADSNYEEVQVKNISQEVFKVLKYNGKYTILFFNGDDYKFNFEEFVPNNDLDGDGVRNIEDAFPNDVAASIDLDNDGYPDSWNSGYTQLDSTSSLTLDYYLNNPDCNLLEHGDGVTCDMNTVIPEFVPDDVVRDKYGTIYFLSNENKRIYRWNTIEKFVKPIVLDNQNVKKIAYSESHDRLYIAYANVYYSFENTGKATYIDLSSNSLEQNTFVERTDGVGHIQDVGKYILIEKNWPSWVDKSIYDKDGNLVSSIDQTYDTDVSFWDEVNSRYYFVPYGSYPSDLYYHNINQSTGEIFENIESPYHGSYNFVKPIMISKNGNKILLGGGDIFNYNGLNWEATVNDNLEDGFWTDTNEIIYGYTDNDVTTIKRKNTSLELIESINYDGVLIKILEVSNNSCLVITKTDKLIFNEYLF